MTKRGTPPSIYETLPTGDITLARPPIAVRARVLWTYGDGDYTIYDMAWAMAWTRTEVEVYLHAEGVERGVLAWLSADQVQRL